MKTGPPKVITLESDSEDELQIVSENIPNYGNFSTPMEIAPELQQKIRLSLEKNGSLPGKIKAIKVFATKRNKEEMGSVRASIHPTNGQPSQTINVGPSINAIFSNGVLSNRVKGGGNNNSRKETNTKITLSPSEPSSPVILYSPVRKRKTLKSRDNSGGAFPSHGFQQTFAHPLIDEENGFQETSTNKLETNVEFKRSSNFPKVPRDLSVNDLELNTSDIFKNLWAGANSNAKPVNQSPMRFSSDDEYFVDDSILAIWDSPVQSPRSAVDPPHNLEDIPILRENNSKSTEGVNGSTKDLDGEEKTLQNTNLKNVQPEDLVSEIGDKLKGCNLISKQYKVVEKKFKKSTKNEHNFANLANQVKQRDKGETILDSEYENIIKDVNSNRQFNSFGSKKQNYSDNTRTPKSVKIDAKIRSKQLSVDNGRNDDQSFLNTNANQDKNPPVWTTMFPSSPPSPPRESWMNSGALYDLDAADFLAVTGLCRLEAAKEIKKNLNAPKPLVRVLRRRRNK